MRLWGSLGLLNPQLSALERYVMLFTFNLDNGWQFLNDNEQEAALYNKTVSKLNVNVILESLAV